jgi:hypothetical protein
MNTLNMLCNRFRVLLALPRALLELPKRPSKFPRGLLELPRALLKRSRVLLELPRALLTHQGSAWALLELPGVCWNSPGPS